MTGPLEVERHMAGHSNETFFVSDGPSRWILRRPPRGAFLPTAHDVGREYQVLSVLADTSVRTPQPVLLCEDADVIGAPFYLMERVDGEVIRERLPVAFEGRADALGGIGEELVDALAELHAVDWRAVGLQGFGRPEGYVERQVRRWRGQLQLTEPLTRQVPDLHRTAQWLERHLPAGGGERAGSSGRQVGTIVHGDYKLDNVCFAPEPPARLVAVFDWEMSTLGEPLADLGWMLSFWAEPGDPVDPLVENMTVTRRPGFSSRQDLLTRYSEHTGCEVGEDQVTFYLVLAVWKLAILLEGSYARHLAGATDDPFFERMEEGVPALARRAWALAGS